MLKATLLGLVGALALALLTSNAGAREPLVVVRTLGGRTCVNQDELIGSLARAGVDVGYYDLELSAKLAPETQDELHEEYARAHTIVEIGGRPVGLEVSVEQDGSVSKQTLPAATCETATDIAAAFLASALAPGIALDVPVDANELTRAIGDELARRGIQLAPDGIRLQLELLKARTWLARLEYTRPNGCRLPVPLGVIATIDPEGVADATDRITAALQKERLCKLRSLQVVPAPTAESPRHKAQRTALDRVPGPVARWLTGGLNTFAGGLLLGAVVIEQQDAQPRLTPSSFAFQLAGAGTLLGGGLASFAVGGDRASDLASTTFFAGYGAVIAGGLYEGGAFAKRMTASGLLYSAGLQAVNLFGRRRPVERLAAARARLKNGVPSVEEARSIERDLARIDPVIPLWLVVAPTAVSSAVATIPFLTKTSTRNDGALFLTDIGFFTLGGLVMVLDAAGGSVWGSYRRDLEAAGLRELSLGPGPAGPLGLSLSGSF